MLKAAIKIIFIQWDTSSAVVLSSLCFDYRILFDYMRITHNETHMKSYKMSQNVKILGFELPNPPYYKYIKIRNTIVRFFHYYILVLF